MPKLIIRSGLILSLLAALLIGGGLGYLAASASHDPTRERSATARTEPGLFDAYYDRGYQRGWTEGYDQGNRDASEGQPSSPEHALTFGEAAAASPRVPLEDAARIARSYHPSGQYQADTYDCNDMAGELWEVYRNAGLASFLVVGNTGATNESFGDCDHCWVVVFCIEPAAGAEVTLAIDAQASLIGVIEAGDAGRGGPAPPGPTSSSAPGSSLAGLTGTITGQYGEGFFYGNPADLKEDLGPRW